MLAKRLRPTPPSSASPCPRGAWTLSQLDMDAVKYYKRLHGPAGQLLGRPPEDIKNTYDRIGIPEAERRRRPGGVGVGPLRVRGYVHHQIRGDLEEQGAISVIPTPPCARFPCSSRILGPWSPPATTKSRPNTAVWSGGSSTYVPKGVHAERSRSRPTSASTRRTWASSECTLIIADRSGARKRI